jgi:hypothetical protein
MYILTYKYVYSVNKGVPVTTTWRVLKLRKEERLLDMEGRRECIE